MFRFLRSTKSINNSYIKKYPDLQTRRVRTLQPASKRKFFSIVAGTTVVSVCGNSIFTAYISDEDLSKEPIKIPLWFIEKVDPIPYRPGCKEWNIAHRFLGDKKSRAQAEKLVLSKILEVMQAQKIDAMGGVVGFHPHYWMWFGLHNPPPPTYRRRYLAITPDKWEVVTAPIEPVTVVRLNSITWPSAVAKSVFKFFQTMLLPEDNSNAQGRIRRLIVTEDPADVEANKGPNEERNPLFEAIENSAFHQDVRRGLAESFMAFNKQWAIDRKPPPPPRGSIVADGVVKILCKKVNFTMDVKVAIDPQKPEDASVLSLTVRHAERSSKGAKRVTTHMQNKSQRPLESPTETS